MKKQKISLTKLALKKEHIADLNSGQQGDILGGGNVSINIPCQATLQIACQETILCVTRMQIQCQHTRIRIICEGIPAQSLACNPATLGC